MTSTLRPDGPAVRLETPTLRLETPDDHRRVEELTREAFWGTESPGCSEHLLVHRLRQADSFVPELSWVAEVGGVVVGHVVYSRAQVVGAATDGPAPTWDVLTFGPLSVLPEHQSTGVGGALMRRTLTEAARLGHRAVVVYGHPDYYPRFGFRRGSVVGITAPGGASFDALMALELVDGGLAGVRGEFHEDRAFYSLDDADVAAFDAAFPPKEPAVLTPLEALDGWVPDAVVGALQAAGLPNVEMLRRLSVRELAAIDGVGAPGLAGVQEFLRARGVAWGR